MSHKHELEFESLSKRIICMSDDCDLALDASKVLEVVSKHEYLLRVVEIARKVTEVVESGVIARTAKTCEHGNCAVAPYNHPWFCDECWIEMQEALKALDEIRG